MMPIDGQVSQPHHRLDPTHRDGWVDEVLTAVDQPLRPPRMDIFGGES